VALSAAGNTAPRNTAPRCTDVAPPADYMYTFVVKNDSDKQNAGTVRVHAGRTRIDMEKSKGSDDYILLTDGGTRMLSVHPDRKEVDQISSPSFEHIIGTSLRAISPLVKFTVVNPNISFARVGTGERILGYATEQIRVTEQFDVRIRAMGFDGGTEHHDRYRLLGEPGSGPRRQSAAGTDRAYRNGDGADGP
jgi:hypothetical protein